MRRRVHWIASVPVPVDPDRAWALFSVVEDWSRWDPLGMADAGWVGRPGWEPGNVLRTGHRPFTFDCEVLRVEAPREVAWRGGGLGTVGTHVYRFLPHAEGCLVQSDEVFEGLVVPVMRPIVRWYWGVHLRAFREWCSARG